MSEKQLDKIKRIVNEARKYLDKDLNGGDFDYPKHDELILSISDNGHMDWLIDTIEELQAERDTLSMAHDSVHRELRQYKAAYLNLSSSLATLTQNNEKLTRTNTNLAQKNEHLTNLLYPNIESIKAEVSE